MKMQKELSVYLKQILQAAQHILKSYPEFAEETKYLNWIGMRGYCAIGLPMATLK